MKLFLKCACLSLAVFLMPRLVHSQVIVDLDLPTEFTPPSNPIPGTILYTQMLSPVGNSYDNQAGFWGWANDATNNQWDFANVNDSGDIATYATGKVEILNDSGWIMMMGLYNAAFLSGDPEEAHATINLSAAGIVTIALDTSADFTVDLETGASVSGLWEAVDSAAAAGSPTPDFYILTSLLGVTSVGGMDLMGALGSSSARSPGDRAAINSVGGFTQCLYYDFDEFGAQIQVFDIVFGSNAMVLNREFLIGSEVIGGAAGGHTMGGGWPFGWGADLVLMPSFSTLVNMKVDAYKY